VVRIVALVVGLIAAVPVFAGEMTASEARQFVVEKLFSYSCFDGTRGLARVHADGSVDGSIQGQGRGLTRHGTLPLGTLRVHGGQVCASLPGIVMQPCFYLERTTAESFRGSISGLSFAYCDFTQYKGAQQLTADR
jgi:hypothetical protein